LKEREGHYNFKILYQEISKLSGSPLVDKEGEPAKFGSQPNPPGSNHNVF
jgi:hypothetical protein